jgi:DNA replication and repair protein RecF
MRRRQKIEYYAVKGAASTEKSIKLNGVKLKNTQPLFEELKYVAFVPDDSEIITGSPENRRNFFDLCISDCHKNYVKILVSFYKALETRNKILRENENLDLIEVYNEEIVKYGTKIYNFRKKFVDNIKKYFTPLYAKITKNMEKVDIIYNSNITPDNYSEKLKLNKNRDLITKYTYFGVQRDDFDITVNGMTARNFASTGQCKSLALCLKLSQSEIFAEFSDEKPIILLDDILAELDDSRRALLYKIIQGSQVFITACNQNIEKYDKKFVLVQGRCP